MGIHWLEQWLEACVLLLSQPFYYLGIVFIILLYRRQILLERKLFHTKLHSLINEVWRTLLFGLLAGAAVSLILMGAGAALQPSSLILLWPVALILSLFRVRFLCFAYAAGILGIVHLAVLHTPVLRDQTNVWIVQALLDLHVPSLLALVAVLHLAEALLIRWQGPRMAAPLFVESKRGKIVGGYQLQGFWPLPVFLLVPAGVFGDTLPWSPLFGQGLWAGGWDLIAFPVMIGFHEMTISRVPKLKIKQSSNALFYYGAAILALAVCAEFWPVISIGAAIIAVVFHEVLIWHSQREEMKHSPFFTHDQRGLRVLAVLPGSPAAELGIEAGEIIHKVNGLPVPNKEELHKAMRQNSAFCKLEILNLEGHSKFLKRAMYSGEHHQLGLILAPDDKAPYYVEMRSTNLMDYLQKKLTRLMNRSGVRAENIEV
jgi:hypothetical protein